MLNEGNGVQEGRWHFMPLPAFQGQGLNTRWPAHPLLRNVAGLLRLLNAIAVVLVGLVVGGVVGRLGHDCNFESERR